MCFVNSQNVRDLRQPFGGTKASGTGREGGTWSYEVFLRAEERLRLASPTTTFRTGARERRSRRDRRMSPSDLPGEAQKGAMSLYGTQKFLFHLNRDPRGAEALSRRPAGAARRLRARRAKSARRSSRGDIGKLYVLGANGQLLMHFAALLGMPWADYIEAMREGVRRHGPVRAGIYAMTTSTDEKVAGRMRRRLDTHEPGLRRRLQPRAGHHRARASRRSGAEGRAARRAASPRRALREARPDALIVVAAEHFANFFMDNMPAYAIGMADHYEGPIEDPGWLGIARTRIPGNADLSRRLIARRDAGRRRRLRRGVEVRPRHHGAAPLPDAALRPADRSPSTSTARARR